MSNRYVHWMIIRLDKKECRATQYWGGTEQGWIRKARAGGKMRMPWIGTSLKEAREEAQNIPAPIPPRTRIWASGSRAKKTMFNV